jgi:hypothetical protein
MATTSKGKARTGMRCAAHSALGGNRIDCRAQTLSARRPAIDRR